MFTSRIPGGAAVLAPADFVLSMVAGVPIYDAAASAGSYLLQDPYLGKAVNIPLALRAMTDYGDADEMLQKAGERREKIESTLEKYTPKPIKKLAEFSLIDYLKGTPEASPIESPKVSEDDPVFTERMTEMDEVMKVPERKASGGLSGVDQYILNRYK